MELWEMVENPLTPLFAFKYDFYCDDLEVKKKFEEKFINHYWLHEIGCETPARWNQMLKSRLNLIMPYYRQLYQTELASQNIDFLLNKDLKESTTRELSGVENDTGNKRLTNEENHDITSSSSVNGESTSSSQSTGRGTQSQEETNRRENTQAETITFKSQGNSGVTSSAELLQKWREVLINIDEMIIKDCHDLFMQVY